MAIRSDIIKGLSGLLFLGLMISPVGAHKVETHQDVGATLHMEPNDNPRAGEPTLAWFALVRKGGQIIPLAQCNCKLAVRTAKQETPLLQPALKAVSAENFQGIPGADIVFPKAGAYELELSGTPKAGANFRPFELSYEVTVAPGAASSSPNPPEVAQSPSQPVPVRQAVNPAIAISTFVGLGAIVVLWRRGRKRS